jgi:hypothetical protein
MKTTARHRAFERHVSKSIINERTYPHQVGIPVAAAGLDVVLSRQILEFHKSRHIQLRHGRTIFRYGQIYYRWCFADMPTARSFSEQFGGSLTNLIVDA